MESYYNIIAEGLDLLHLRQSREHLNGFILLVSHFYTNLTLNPKPCQNLFERSAENQSAVLYDANVVANLLKLADAYRKTRLRRKATEFYEKVVKEYPTTAAAKKAREWLKSLR